MSYLETDLSMAAISEVKVPDLDKVVHEANLAIDSGLLTAKHRDKISGALDRINSKKNHEITPEFVEEIDEEINEVSKEMITDDDEGKLEFTLNGTESFGFTLTPQQWRESRIKGCETLLEDLGRQLKRWTSTLSEKLSEIFTGNQYTIESLEERFVELEKKLTFIDQLSGEKEFISISAGINKTFYKGHSTLTTNPDFPKLLNNEIQYVGICLKSWIDESVRYKNNLVRFFGNKAKGDLKTIQRVHPKLFSKKVGFDKENTSIAYYIPPQALMGGVQIGFGEHFNYNFGTELELMISETKDVGYDFVRSDDINVDDVKVTPRSIDDLEALKGSIKNVISVMKLINKKNNDFDADTSDVKDVSSTLKDAEDNILLEGFSELVARYQENTIYIQAAFIRYLGQIASHLITFMFLHMEAYDDA